jgi:hypothetical protein
VNPSLSIYNTAAGEYGLSVGMYCFFIALALVTTIQMIKQKSIPTRITFLFLMKENFLCNNINAHY